MATMKQVAMEIRKTYNKNQMLEILKKENDEDFKKSTVTQLSKCIAEKVLLNK
jgi:uncharacterized protein YehS (DUF1456 family)